LRASRLSHCPIVTPSCSTHAVQGHAEIGNDCSARLCELMRMDEATELRTKVHSTAFATKAIIADEGSGRDASAAVS
jgi:hypothetical protein